MLTAQARSCRALALEPSFLQALLNHGMALNALGRPADGVRCATRAVRLCPSDARGWNNLGNGLRMDGRPQKAAAALRCAAVLEPASASVWSNLSSAWAETSHFDDARACLSRALTISPGNAALVFNRSLLSLACGRWAEGWRDYRARYTAGHVQPRPFPQPEWNADTPPASLVIWGEQGLGDEIMFASVLPELPMPTGSVVFETDARLVRLFARSFPELHVVPRTTPPAPPALAAEVQLPLADLVGRLRSDRARFPAGARYLAPDRCRTGRLRVSLTAMSGSRPLIGLAWRSGSPRNGRLRSIPAPALAPLLAVDRVRFVSLQAQETEVERASLSDNRLLRPNGIDHREDIDGLAALLSALDLVITIDTTTAHLAGALGMPTWTLLPSVAEWRWGRTGHATPWYPTMRLFRQTEPSTWEPVVVAVANALAKREWP